MLMRSAAGQFCGLYEGSLTGLQARDTQRHIDLPPTSPVNSPATLGFSSNNLHAQPMC